MVLQSPDPLAFSSRNLTAPLVALVVGSVGPFKGAFERESSKGTLRRVWGVRLRLKGGSRDQVTGLGFTLMA